MAEVRSLLGVAKYLCFIPVYATLTQPLCELTQKDTLWECTERLHSLPVGKNAFQKILYNYIAQTSAPNTLTWKTSHKVTLQDRTLQAVIDAVCTRNWFEPVKHLNINTNTYKALERVKDELTICSHP